MKTMIKNLSFLLASVIILSACGQRPSENLAVDMEDVEVGELQISSETMNEIIQNIASPIEVAALISSLNIPFSTSYLADPDQLSTSTTSFEMAFYLGALSADLGYLNMYEKTGSAVNYLSSINRLADALQIGQFFDFATIKRLATTSSDLDSLMFISVNSFNNMDGYLRETERSNLSALMIAGVWLEGLYLATQVSTQNQNEDLESMIGEQKLILNDLLLVLNNYRNVEIIQGYITDFEAIKKAYDDVKITYEVGEPQTIEKDGMLMVVQSETSHVNMSNETLQDIVNVTREIRNMYMNI
ncbi:MAG: hypothetical protein EHM46_03525 [Bacteroidetes bacterium]|nr:MAG: hypothetical protein EHM46_03525 [Bacteroidota bacterium]